MLTTYLKFEGNRGEGLIGTVDSVSVKDFQKLQKKITQDMLKMGDDVLEGRIPINKGAELNPQAVAIVSMETVGTGDHAGWYSKTTQESRFDHQGTYDAFVDFNDSLLSDILEKAGDKGHGHGKKK